MRILSTLAAATLISGCSLNELPALKPIGSKNLADVSSLVSIVQCDLKLGAEYASSKGLTWVKDSKRPLKAL